MKENVIKVVKAAVIIGVFLTLITPVQAGGSSFKSSNGDTRADLFDEDHYYGTTGETIHFSAEWHAPVQDSITYVWDFHWDNSFIYERIDTINANWVDAFHTYDTPYNDEITLVLWRYYNGQLLGVYEDTAMVHISPNPTPPELSYNPTSHNFGRINEGQTASTTFEIWNSGENSLTYSLSESCTWITDISPSSGSSNGEHDPITVTIDTSSLSGGYHSDEIHIISNGGDGDFTVECTVNQPPNEPTNPCPSNESIGFPIEGDISWTGGDPNGDTVYYNVYLGTDPTPDSGELVSQHQTSTSYDPGTLQFDRTYYWKIVANDGLYTINGPIWHFTTRSTYSIVNLDTGEAFASIQDAIDDDDTIDGHTIKVYNGIYYENNIVINKAIILLGENKDTTIVDGTEDFNRVFLINTDGVTISGFTIENGGNCGIDIASDGNVISGNIISNNGDGVSIVWWANDNLVTDNIIRENSCGISIGESDDNIIYNNTVINNNIGITAVDCERNSIYHNNFMNSENGINQLDSHYNTDMMWNESYPIGGNYWDDFDEPNDDALDVYHGPNQNIPGSDGIVDSPYDLHTDTVEFDYLPWMEPNGWNQMSVTFEQEHYYYFTDDDSLQYTATVFSGFLDSAHSWTFTGFGDNPIYETTDEDEFPMMTIDWSFIEPGDYEISVSVLRDSDGALATDTAIVHVFPPHNPISAESSSINTDINEMLGLATCPSGHEVGTPYLVKVNILDVNGDPVVGIPARSFDFTVDEEGDAENYSALSCSFTPVGLATDGNGDIIFEVIGDTSIIGNIRIGVSVEEVTIDDTELIQCNSVDINCNGAIDLIDIVLFTQSLHIYDWRCDFNWDGVINLSDMVLFTPHIGHSA